MNYQLKEIIRNNYFLLIAACFISVIIRIPFLNFAPTGQDSFVMYWIGSLVLQGKLGTWELNILSLFGMYPFSGYPIGGVLLITILEFFFPSITLTFFAYSTLCAIVAVLLSYKVFRKFTDSVELAVIGALIYSTFPDFILYTYLSASIRGIFIALLPGFYLLCIKFYDKPSIKNFLLVVGGVIFISLFHRTGNVTLAWVTVLVFLVLVQIINFEKLPPIIVNVKNIFDRSIFIILGLFAIVFMYLSAYIITPNPQELANPFFGIKPGLNVFLSVFIDICLRIGPVIFIFFLGVIQFLYSKLKNKEIENKYLEMNFLFLFVLSPFFTESLYLTLLIALPINVFSVQFLNTILKEKNYKKQKIKYWIIGAFLIFFNSLYYIAYDIFVIQVQMYVLLFVILSILILITMVYSYADKNFINTNKFKRIFYSLLILSVLLFSSFQIAMVFERNSTFPYDYLTNQEVQVANKLKELDKQAPVGRILISNQKIAVHIMALTGYLTFNDPYFMSYLVDGSINASLLENNSQLRPVQHWYYNYIYSVNYSALAFNPNVILTQIFSDDMQTALPVLASFHTRYIITLNSTVVNTGWVSFNSTLIQNMFSNQNSTLIYSTQDILLWKLTY